MHVQWLVTIMTFFPFATKIHTRYIMAWYTWHCGWNSSWFFFFFFQSKKEISVKSQYIHYLIHPRYNRLLQVIFLVYITYVRYSQFSLELGKFTTYLKLRYGTLATKPRADF